MSYDPSSPSPSGQPPYGQSPSGQPPSGQPPQPFGYQPAPYGVPPTGAGGVPPLWAPYYGAPPVAAVKRFFQKYATFSGRASRSEYWWAALALTIAFFILFAGALFGGLAGATTDASGDSNPGPGFWPFAFLLFFLWVGVLVPSLSITVRRLHDIDMSGWLVLINLVPYLGSFVLFILSLLASNPAGARFDRPTS